MNPHYAGFSGVKVRIFKKGTLPLRHSTIGLWTGIWDCHMAILSFSCLLTSRQKERLLFSQDERKGQKNMSGTRDHLDASSFSHSLWKTSLEDYSYLGKGSYSGSDFSVRRFRITLAKKSGDFVSFVFVSFRCDYIPTS